MELLTVPEVAKRLKIGLTTAYLMCERGQLPCIKIGRSVRVPSDELDKWIKSQLPPRSAASPSSPK